jgi:pimeloyl-ACP methyl ester carboxylesterase
LILDFRLYYETHGAGEQLVLIPGFASGAWIWQWQISDFARHFQVIMFDPPGVARSPASRAEEITLEYLAAEIIALLDFLGIAQAHVLGASFGGFVAQELALAYPERVQKLILACTGFGGKNHVAPNLEVLAAFVAADDLNRRERIRRFMIPAFTPQFNAEHGEIVEQVCLLREQNPVESKVYHQQLQAALNFDAEARVSNIKAETLVLTGNKDFVVPPQNSENLARAIPSAELKVIKGGSHLFFIEKAAEFNKITIEFLSS